MRINSLIERASFFQTAFKAKYAHSAEIFIGLGALCFVVKKIWDQFRSLKNENENLLLQTKNLEIQFASKSSQTSLVSWIARCLPLPELKAEKLELETRLHEGKIDVERLKNENAVLTKEVERLKNENAVLTATGFVTLRALKAVTEQRDIYAMANAGFSDQLNQQPHKNPD